MKRILGVAVLTALMACNQSENKTIENKDSNQVDSSKNTSVVIKDQKKSEIFSQYEDLKNALVNSDSSEAQKSAIKLEKSLATYEGCESTASIARKISETTNIVSQRKEFTALSMDLIAFIKSGEIEKGTVYVQHCPMANKGDGGDWLSIEKDIKNPYYGKEMLTCGRVVEEIKSK
ncbi:DUF3347 domain-containing protein [Pedobacter sp. Leaf176]|uniref:DUF3347 domain-containing protein n=1 Tax=Pedobacter sp. Leaf176 TaxID=1736286 RepID=UPI0006F93580|nr:DUF3347 domain-containing protein [Pedobacter sp. Leaf176]KQR67564.1 hypothetical protein ASF92_17950 [Pedobacter sp. Leaf176]